MASRIVDACDLAGKPFPFVFNHSQFNGSGQVERDGLVKSPHVTPEVQVQLLAVVDATGSASVGDCIHALEGHPAPVAAILDMASAGYLEIGAGIISEHLRVSRGCAQFISSGSGGGDDEGPNGSGGKPSGSKLRNLSAKAAKSLEGSVVYLPRLDIKLIGSPMRPEVFVLNRTDLTAVRPGGPFDRPVIYLGLTGKRAYVGMSGNGADRLRGQHLAGYDKVVAIADASNTMTRDQALVGERILGLSISAMAEHELDCELPHGGACSREDYLALRLMVGEALVLIREGGIGFREQCPRDLLAGPLGLSEMLDAEVHHRDVEHTLESVGVQAEAVEVGEGDWVVKAGSEVRIVPVASAGSVILSLRHELDFSGVLVRKGGHYRMTRNLRFSSASAAGNFVTGAKYPNRSGWLPIVSGKGLAR